jgi:hypothetical protein
MMQLMSEGIKTMAEVVELIRNFNTAPGRILPIVGIEFGLDRYLSSNPDDLSEEECDALAAEFGLQKREEPKDDESNDPQGAAVATAEVVSIESSDEGSGSES